MSYTIDQLVPHSGRMSLLEQLLGYGDEHLEAGLTIHNDTVFVTEQGVPAWIGIEYLAQAIGAFAGLQERLNGGEPKIGFLVGTRKYDCNVEWFPKGAELRIRAEREMIADNGLSVFQCELTGRLPEDTEPSIHASARLNVYQPDDVAEYMNSVKAQ